MQNQMCLVSLCSVTKVLCAAAQANVVLRSNAQAEALVLPHPAGTTVLNFCCANFCCIPKGQFAWINTGPV